MTEMISCCGAAADCSRIRRPASSRGPFRVARALARPRRPRDAPPTGVHPRRRRRALDARRGAPGPRARLAAAPLRRSHGGASRDVASRARTLSSPSRRSRRDPACPRARPGIPPPPGTRAPRPSPAVSRARRARSGPAPPASSRSNARPGGTRDEGTGGKQNPPLRVARSHARRVFRPDGRSSLALKGLRERKKKKTLLTPRARPPPPFHQFVRAAPRHRG